MMRARKDGEQTRRRILEAAAEPFSLKGFRCATHADICYPAGTNVAAVNYHFGSKEGLYVAPWRFIEEETNGRYPVEGGVLVDAPADERLAGQIRTFLKRTRDRGHWGRYHRLHMMEIVNPTGLVDEVIRDVREPHRWYTLAVLRELLKPEPSERPVELCEFSVISQCRMVRTLHDTVHR